MSRVWRLHTKPKVSVKNKLETKVANELIKKKNSSYWLDTKRRYLQ